MMIAMPLFPVLIGKWQYPDKVAFKEVFNREALKHLTADGRSDESTGHVCLHHDPALAPIYEFATECVLDYLATMSVAPDRFDINVVKSWLNVLQDDSTPPHNHADAHLAVVYYANLPENHKHPLRFYNDHGPNDLFHGLMKFNTTGEDWNVFNSMTWRMYPEEGDLFVFPAGLTHDNPNEGAPPTSRSIIQTPEDMASRRVSIASDVLLTYTTTTPSPLGLQPTANWRRFGGATPATVDTALTEVNSRRAV